MEERKKKILIVEDEKNIAQVEAFNLMQAGYLVDLAQDGKNGLAKALTGDYDLILLDIMLPEMDGFTICRQIRTKLDTPIIMVTAKEEETDKIFGLDVGADDYVTKPFSVNLLLARVKANIRRASGELISSKKENEAITIRGLIIDNDSGRVTRDGHEISLSKNEYDLLLFLASHRGKLFSREDLLSSVWGYQDYYGDKRTVDVTIRRLRTKLEDDPSHPQYIFSRHGVGYYLE